MGNPTQHLYFKVHLKEKFKEELLNEEQTGTLQN